MTNPTRDTAKAIRTAEQALSAGKLDRARRALVYACTRFGVQREMSARLGRAFKLRNDAGLLSAILRVCKAKQAQREQANQAVRNLFAGA